MHLIKNVDIFDGKNILLNKDVYLAEGKIIGICPAEKKPSFIDDEKIFSLQKCNFIEGEGHLLAPGFIDIQINGGGGVYFNESPCVETLQKIQQAHLAKGTTSLLPTFISDNFSNIEKAIVAIKESIAQGLHGILGLHIEGPYLNENKNGIHLKEFIRTPAHDEIMKICNSNLPITLLTVAPEIFSVHFLEQISKKNIILFAGHTNATFEQMEEAFSHGVSGITHFFNACSPFLSRAPGVVGAGLYHDDIWCGLIADGLHVDYSSIKIAFKCKGTHHFILVSDAMSAVGTDMEEFFIQGQKIFVKNGKYIDASGTLAGSSLTLHQALINIVSSGCASLPSALAMASTNAAQCLRIDHRKGKVAPQYDADLVLLEKNTLNILSVIQNGDVVYESKASRSFNHRQ